MGSDTEKRKLLWFGSIYLLLLLSMFLIVNLNDFNQWLGGVIKLFRPVIIGLILAYFLNPAFRFFERRVLSHVRPHSFRRILALFLSYLLLIVILGLILLLIIPQFVSSITNLTENYQTYIDTLINEVNNFIDRINAFALEQNPQAYTIDFHLDNAFIQEKIGNFISLLFSDGSSIIDYLSFININSVSAFITKTVSIFSDILFGIFVSLYFLNSKEKRYAQIIRLRKAIFPEAFNDRLTQIITVADRSFGGFMRGKLVDSFIISILIYIANLIFDIPYALLVAVIIGITDIIPIIGPIFGTIPAGIIVLINDPKKLILFVLIIIAVQQLDGHIITPRVLGDNTGVSSLCVLISITVMGTLWGFAGMILGVPIFATVLELAEASLQKRLQKKDLPADPESYYFSEVKELPSEQETADETSAFEAKTKELKNSEGTDGLSAFEAYRLDTYSRVCKHNLIENYTEEDLNAFISEHREVHHITDEVPAKKRKPDAPVGTVEDI